jgi:hypothetical protein
MEIRLREAPLEGVEVRDFGTLASTARFWPAFEEQRQCFHAEARPGWVVALADRPRAFQGCRATVMAELVAVC